MPHANLHEVGLYYEVHGDGEPVVLLHKELGCTNGFNKQTHEFSKHFRVVTYARHGYGRSTHVTALKEGWLEECVEELSRFLDEIKVDRAHACGIRVRWSHRASLCSSNRELLEEPINWDWVQGFMGGNGLGVRYLYALPGC